ncbi:hypothetical protein [Spiroplasma endosymbiont of Polydrusus formosus]|uniref:hypothetical protein n=1 Tax=Spiroplasma endosymbiont of Polydrusus formosus TaxID=3139326 RepID=UPI0035B53421
MQLKKKILAIINPLQPTDIVKYSYIKLYQKGDWLFAISKIGLVNKTMTLITIFNNNN